MDDASRTWWIRRNGQLEGPFTEYELRCAIVGADLNGVEVKQGKSQWFSGMTVLKKFKELARAGVYLRSGDKKEGPFTAVRTLEKLRRISLENSALDAYDARVGLNGDWIPASKFLAQLERIHRSETKRKVPLTKNDDSNEPNHLKMNQRTLTPIGPATVEQDERPVDYPRLPNQQRPILYILPAVFIAVWGAMALVYASTSLFSSGLGVLVVATWVSVDDTAIGVGARVIGNVVFITLVVIMLLGSVSMILRRNLRLARASAVLATIPCVGYFVMPFGLWACVVLFTREAERDFL